MLGCLCAKTKAAYTIAHRLVSTDSSNEKVRWLLTKHLVLLLESEVTGQLDLEAVRRTLQPHAGGLVIDDEQIAVRAVDIAQPHVYGGKACGGIELKQCRSKQLAQKVVINSARKQIRGEIALRQAHVVEGVGEVKEEVFIRAEGHASGILVALSRIEVAPLVATSDDEALASVCSELDGRAVLVVAPGWNYYAAPIF